MKIHELQVGKQYKLNNNKTADTYMIDESRKLFYLGYDKVSWIVSGLNYNIVLDYNFEEIKVKKRYWKWDIKCESGGIFECVSYMDDNGYTTTGYKNYSKDILFKKHEDKFIEV